MLAQLVPSLWWPALLGLAACMPQAPKGLDSPIPQERMEAAVAAAERKDISAVPSLVVMLKSDDPAVRLVAINSLEVITGERLGYDATASDAERSEGIDRWKEWSEKNVPKTMYDDRSMDIGRPPRPGDQKGGGPR